jgi:uncharacterized metal-binding protein
MRTILRPLPVLYACRGCAEHGSAATQVAALVERAGLAETAWLGTPGLEPKTRFPIFALDGCADACALAWLARHGIRPERHYVMQDREVRRAFDAIAADLA